MPTNNDRIRGWGRPPQPLRGRTVKWHYFEVDRKGIGSSMCGRYLAADGALVELGRAGYKRERCMACERWLAHEAATR